MNCKKGDIALVVKGPCAGVLVECLEWQGYYRTADGNSANDCWFLRSLCSYRFQFNTGPSKTGYGRDSNLMPIGTALKKTQKRAELESKNG